MNSSRKPKAKFAAAALYCGLAFGLAACASEGPKEVEYIREVDFLKPKAAAEAKPAPAPAATAATPAPAAAVAPTPMVAPVAEPSPARAVPAPPAAVTAASDTTTQGSAEADYVRPLFGGGTSRQNPTESEAAKPLFGGGSTSYESTAAVPATAAPPAAPQAFAAPAPAPTPEVAAPEPAPATAAPVQESAAPAPATAAPAPAAAAPTAVVDNNWDMPQAPTRTLPVSQVEVETPSHYTGVPEPEYQDTSGKDCFRTWDENGREHAVCMAPPTHGRRQR